MDALTRRQKSIASLSKKCLNHLQYNIHTVIHNAEIECKKNEKELSCGDTILFLFLREIEEHLQGLEILYKNNLVKSSVSIIRVIYELVVQLKYLTIDEKKFEYKGICYVIYDYWKREKFSKKAVEIFFEKGEHTKNIDKIHKDYLMVLNNNEYARRVKDEINKINKRIDSWYELYQCVEEGKYEKCTLNKMVQKIDEIEKNTQIDEIEKNTQIDKISDIYSNMYTMIYGYLSMQAHGGQLTTRMISNNNSNEYYMVPIGFPDNGFLGLRILNQLQILIIRIVGKKYFDDTFDWKSENDIINDVERIIDKISALDKDIFEDS